MKASGSRLISALGISLIMATAASSPAWAWEPEPTKGGSRLTLTKQAVWGYYRQAAFPSPRPPFYQWGSVLACEGNSPEHPGDNSLCVYAVSACAGNSDPEGQGPALRLYRREVGEDGKPLDVYAPWEYLGVSCWPKITPGKGSRLTMAMIVKAFHETDFAVAELNSQPEGEVTLVRLPTYFEVVWPEAGFEPGETDKVNLGGFDVEIRPVLRYIDYNFGNGEVLSGSTSLGGPYPSGDVITRYAEPGRYAVRADVTYTGQFRVNGGDWIDIPGAVTIPGDPLSITVKSSTNRLIPPS